MRVLDIDLDFFLADCCPLAKRGERPDVEGHEPWQEERVIAFLEQQCGLDASKPVEGKVFETHDGALTYWQRQMERGRLTAPFHVTHVDAHSDLGIGYPGPGYVLNGVLPQLLDMRADVERYYRLEQLDEANYLLFALAFRWVSGLDNVRNPKSRSDIPQGILVPGREDAIQLCSFASRLSENINGPEPVIPFSVYGDYGEFRASGHYDYVSLAISPRYAPQEADVLIDVISRYIKR